MMSRSTLVHLRFPFSIFLMPVFLFAVAAIDAEPSRRVALAFVLLHFFVYPASNGFNSFFDRDEESIGGVARPPRVKADLLTWSLVLDAIGLFLAWGLGVAVFAGVVVYGCASKLYSHPRWRWKAHPWGGLLVVAACQGFLVFAIVAMAARPGIAWVQFVVPAVIASLMIAATYPLTQIYQHGEDARRGDRTVSRVLGLRGTFGFAAVGLVLAFLVLSMWLILTDRSEMFPAMAVFHLPAGVFFSHWMRSCWRDPAQANHANAMRMNLVSAVGSSIFFVVMWAH
jgi:1,4-dihydroxy-2-naphthoate octaprenyltransferase